ncbi:MAG: RNase adapter RapZ [Actinomycetota bacterium]|nr:RNase adapter RapZ [Actinomycetota bacterium]
MEYLDFTIITGFSGAGKSEAVKCFEDMGYFCIDNLPPSLILKMVELFSLPGSKVKKVALVIDVRLGGLFEDLFAALNELDDKAVSYQILFLEASDDELIRRFKETRRRHPLSVSGQVIEGIAKERSILEDVKGRADMVIDTSGMRVGELKDKIRSSFLGDKADKSLLITVISFGYKYGIPHDVDIIMDVRFLPNPHYIEDLKMHTGEEAPVREFVLKRPETKVFLNKFLGLLDFLIPKYIDEGKTHFVIALGCTGGTHRSVVLAEETKKFLQKRGFNSTLMHRDIGKDFSSHDAKR